MTPWTGTHFLLQATIVFGFNYFAAKRIKSGFGGSIYLCFLPFLFLYQGELVWLILGLALGTLAYFPLTGRSWLPAGLILILTVWQIRQGMHIDYPIQVLNQLRGEHLNVAGLVTKLLHNKVELAYFWMKKLEDQIGINRLYLSGKFSLLSPYFLLGYLYPWDILFHYRALRHWLVRPQINFAQVVWWGSCLFILGLIPASPLGQVVIVALLYSLGLVALSQIKKLLTWSVAAVFYVAIQTYLAFNFIVAR
jgi:hypothetical protein